MKRYVMGGSPKGGRVGMGLPLLVAGDPAAVAWHAPAVRRRSGGRLKSVTNGPLRTALSTAGIWRREGIWGVGVGVGGLKPCLARLTRGYTLTSCRPLRCHVAEAASGSPSFQSKDNMTEGSKFKAGQSELFPFS